MAADPKFSEIPNEDLKPLLDDLEKDIPISVHPWAFLKVIEKWRTVNSEWETKILALNGDFRTRMIIFYILNPTRQYMRGIIHKWTHRTDDDVVLAEAMKLSVGDVPWQAKRVEIPDLTPETATGVRTAMAEIWRNKKWEIVCDDLLYWVPKEEAAAWSVDIPDGIKLSFLDETHLKEIIELWQWSDAGTEERFKAVLRVNFGMGLFDSESGELMSWAFQKYYGGIGVLVTKEHHRRKSYGKILLKSVAKEMAIRGFHVHGMVSMGNDASKSLFAKCNFRLGEPTYWVEKKEDY